MERHFTRWSEDDDAVLAECLEKGIKKESIARALGRTTDSVTWRASYIRKNTQRSLPLNAPAKKVEARPNFHDQPSVIPKAPEVPDPMLDRVLEAERMIQQIPMLTLIAGIGAMMSFTTFVLVILAMLS
jgi:hypothetical protein